MKVVDSQMRSSGRWEDIAQLELVLGVALLMAETLGSTQVPHVQERLAELMVHTEVMKASLRAAEADAQLDRWGVMCPAGLPLEVIRTLFMNVYPRMVEILQLLGSSSFMIIPSEKDFDSAMRPEIEQYLATDTASARERVKLFRLAWDIACSAFGGRQVLYERFFAGDPLNRAQFLYSIYPKDSVMERVREFLAKGRRGIGERPPPLLSSVPGEHGAYSRLLKNSVCDPTRGRSKGTISPAQSCPLRGGRHDAWRRPSASRHLQPHLARGAGSPGASVGGPSGSDGRCRAHRTVAPV